MSPRSTACYPGRNRPPSCVPFRTRDPALLREGQVTRLLACLSQGGQRPRRLARLDEQLLTCVAFTGDPKSALELDADDPLGTWAAKSWDVLRVLDGYAAARRRGEFSKGVHAYLGHSPRGRPG